jgi:predicted N-acetyltransferase YhbS
MIVRPTTDRDLTAVLDAHRRAFGADQGQEIVDLVRDLLNDQTAMPVLSLAAVADAGIVGHVLFTAVSVQGSEEQAVARILAPLAVLPEHQRKGVGGALINEGLKRLADAGVELVFVLGDPAYYGRFGFSPAGVLGLEATHPIPAEYEDAWMTQALAPDVLGRVRGRVRCADVLNEPRHWLSE